MTLFSVLGASREKKKLLMGGRARRKANGVVKLNQHYRDPCISYRTYTNEMKDLEKKTKKQRRLAAEGT